MTVRMTFYSSIYSLLAFICVHHFSSGTAIHRFARHADKLCDELEKPGWTIRELANVTIDLWPWNCLNLKYQTNDSLSDDIRPISNTQLKAIKQGNIGFVQFYVEVIEAPLDIRDSEGETVLTLAVQRWYSNIVKYLASKVEPPALLECNSDRHTPAEYAAKLGNLDILKYFLEEKNFDKFLPDKDKTLLLCMAAKGGHLPVMRYLIEERNYLDYVDSRGNYDETAVHCAAQSTSLQMIKYLIEEKGADANVVSENGDSPLHFAAHHGPVPVVKYFVDEKHISVEAKDNAGRTPVHRAVLGNKLDVVKFLLEEKKADRNVRDKDGRTLLHQAIYSEDVDMMRYLVDDVKMLAQIDEQDTMKCTAVCHAASEGQLDILKFLVDEKKAKTTVVDSRGENILHTAAKNCRREIVKYLFEDKGFDIHLKTPSGENARDLAAECQWRKKETVEYLKQKMNL